MPDCWKCKSQLLYLHEEWRCQICGATQTMQTQPTIPPKETKPYQPHMSAPSLTRWILRNQKCLGTASIKKVRQILYTLPPPFMKCHTKPPFVGIQLPCFESDREYRTETATIVGYKRKEQREALLRKNEEINKHLCDLPTKAQAVAKVALWLCDERNRERVMLEDCKIRWFFRFIKYEQEWLELSRQLVRIRRSWNRKGLLEEELSGSLLSIRHDLFDTAMYDVQTRVLGKSKHQNPREQIFNAIQCQIDEAHSIVTRAAIALKPATAFYKSRQPSREIKQALLQIVAGLYPKNKKQAARSLQALLFLADPKRPVNADALRVMIYGR